MLTQENTTRNERMTNNNNQLKTAVNIEQFGPNDVMSCKGTKAFYHDVNWRFHALIDCHSSRCVEATKNESLKTQIANSIV
mmetsp:Transcript_31985/g.47206  ORF Transcript_31985/g.47206 Transcript_31985/m.47206 type:complete len:81 (-) Transcript_31985:1558-1800(-)